MSRRKSASKLFEQENPTPMEDESMNLPEEETEAAEERETSAEEPVSEESKIEEPTEVEEKQSVNLTPNEEGIIDVEFNEIKKQRFRFNGDNSKILELNVRDLGVSYRLNDAYNKLNDLMEEVGNTLSDVPDEGDVPDDVFDRVTKKLKKLDDSMREQIDYLFNAPVSSVLGTEGSMYDPIGGVFRYEHIIDKLTSFYETKLNEEFFILKQRVSDRTSKYTKVQKAKKYHR